MSHQGLRQRISSTLMAIMYAVTFIVAAAVMPASTASAALAPLPPPAPPTTTPTYQCDWMGELHFRNTGESTTTDTNSTRLSTSRDALDFVTAQVPGETCGMLWTGERDFNMAQQSATFCSYNWISTQLGSGSGTGSVSTTMQFPSDRPIYFNARFTAETGGTITYVNDYQIPGCGTDTTDTLAWTPNKAINDCFDTYFTSIGMYVSSTAQASVGKCTRHIDTTSASERSLVDTEITWRFKKINCDNTVNSDGGSRSDCQEYDDNTNPMDASDDPVVVTDSTKPTITLNAPLDGGSVVLGSSATANYTCQDEAGGSGLASCVSAVANGAALDTASLGSKTFAITATDVAGNTETATAIYTVTPPPDTSKPTITLNAPLNGGTVLLGSSATASYSCQDEAGGSGLASCNSTVANGSGLDTSTVGTKTFVVTATDNAGNTETATASYTVIYQNSGFLGPVDGNVLNKAKAGQTIPVQFRLLDGNGNPISTSSSFVSLTSAGTTCSASEPNDAIEQYSGGSGLQYLGDGYWQYNWKTAKSYAGQCRILYLTLADGSKASARFQF